MEKKVKNNGLTNKVLTAANKAILMEFKKLSHVCKHVSKLSNAELKAAFESYDKIDKKDVDALVKAYSLVLSKYDLVKVVACYLANIDGTYCKKVVVSKKDLLNSSKSIDRESKYELISGEKYKPEGYFVTSLISTDKDKPFKLSSETEKAVTISGFVAKDTFSVGDVLKAVKAFIQLGSERDRFVSQKETGNSRKKNSKKAESEQE